MTRQGAVFSPALWICGAAGVTIGLMTLRLAEMPNRWVIASLVGCWTLVLVLATGQVRRAALFVFVLSLQMGLALYLTAPVASSVGVSWPNALALPLALLTAVGALAAGGTRKLVWGGGIAIATLLIAVTTATSIPLSPVRLIGVSHLVQVGAYFVIFLAAANAVGNREDLKLVRRALMLSLLLQSAVYFAQYLLGSTFTLTGEWVENSEGGLERYGGTTGTRPAAFSSFLLPLLLAAVAEFLTMTRPRLWSCTAPVVAGSAALILTYTRASWIGFALGLIYLVSAGARRRLLVRRNLWALVLVAVAVGTVLAPKILARASENHAAAIEERWALVQMAVRVIEANPLTGVGAGAYPFVFREFLTPELADRWLFVVHNVYVLRAAETGLPGVGAWLLFLWITFRRASPERVADVASQRFALGWRAGLIALSWQMLWDVSLGPSANSLLWFLCGLMAAVERLEKQGSAQR